MVFFNIILIKTGDFKEKNGSGAALFFKKGWRHFFFLRRMRPQIGRYSLIVFKTNFLSFNRLFLSLSGGLKFKEN